MRHFQESGLADRILPGVELSEIENFEPARLTSQCATDERRHFVITFSNAVRGLKVINMTVCEGCASLRTNLYSKPVKFASHTAASFGR